MSARWFSILRDMVERKTGVALDPNKHYLAESRLAELLVAHNLERIEDLVASAAIFEEPAIQHSVIDAMMTGETFFFRDSVVFDYLRDGLIPAIIERNGETRRLRIWSAACSSGQEAYSIAMIMDELGDRLRGWCVEIVADDISRAAIERARAGIYNQFEVQRGLPVHLLLRYFQRYGERWQIAEHIRSRIAFEQSSILKPSADKLASFDIVFCRNILMYFDRKARETALDALTRCLAPGGHLILGASESALARDRRLQCDGQHLSIFTSQDNYRAETTNRIRLAAAAE